MSVSEKVKCINGNEKELSISRQCELLQLRRSSYYGHRDCHIEDEGLSEPQWFSCKQQTLWNEFDNFIKDHLPGKCQSNCINDT